MSKRLLSFDPVLGISRYFHAADDGNSFVIETEQECEPIIEENKQVYNDAPARMGGMVRVASLPTSIYFKLKREGIADDPVAFKRWLSDPDNRFFRTHPGAL